MNWFKRIFCSQEEFNAHVDINGLPSVDNILPMPKVKPCKPEKDISEPVLSFVECVRNNPKRFDVEEHQGGYFHYSTGHGGEYKLYKLWDKSIKKGWKIKGARYVDYGPWVVEYVPGARYFSDTFFLTEDEKKYIIKEVKEIMEYRKERKTTLDKIRTERRIRDERNRLKEIYK